MKHPRPRVIATGHQPYLWHPGILAKYLAAAQAARRLGGQVLNVVVDQDVAENALTLDLPIQDRLKLSIHRFQLAPQTHQAPQVPAMSFAPLDVSEVVKRLQDARDSFEQHLAVDLAPLINAWTDLPHHRNLARQLVNVLDRLMAPYAGHFPTVFASELLSTPAGGDVLRQMLDDPRRCVLAYNEAALAHPEARISPLVVEPGRVELPLWHIEPRDTQLGATQAPPRRRVFASFHAGQEPRLVTDSGAAVPPHGTTLAPRALLLTAFMRTYFCDLFIHGKGGHLYDRVTDQWWKSWIGEQLAPTVMVTADVPLPFDVPVADAAQLARAQWWAHHLPHNLDRPPPGSPGSGPGSSPGIESVSNPSPSLASEKHELLAHMDDDRDRVRRSAAFARIHRINRELAQLNGPLLDEAQRHLEYARVGRANHAVATKRDWCFALYPVDTLDALSNRVAHPDPTPKA